MSEKYQDFRAVQKAYRAENQERKQDEKERVTGALRERFSAIPQGCTFDTKDLGNVHRVTVIRPTTEDARSVNVVLFFEKDGKEKHTTVTLTDSGRIPREIPRMIKGVSQDELAAEILRNLEAIQPEFWTEIGTPVLPEGEGIPIGPQEKRTVPEKGAVIDPERIKFIRELGARFGGLDASGLSGYHVFVFDGFLVLENERKGNALFVVDIPAVVVLPGTQATEAQRVAFFKNKKIAALLGQTKQELIAHEATLRIVHQGDWKKQLTQAIAEKGVARKKRAQ